MTRRLMVEVYLTRERYNFSFMPHITIGTAGHIDHGKTSLVKALTGIDTDRLKEEKERGITIDLGFANLALDNDTTLGFVDVPGHERFIKNMLAGVGGIDVVMLVIAADESVMPQTREHLAICSLLRVQQGLTVLTKVDAVDTDLVDLAEVEVREFLRGSFLESAPILRVSARTGEGLAALVETLRALAASTVARDATQIFRIPIDRLFSARGFGTVAAGTLISGRVRRDEEVEVLPSAQRARVRGVQVHGRSVEEARAGQRTALNLQRIELEDLERGMVITVPDTFTPTRASIGSTVAINGKGLGEVTSVLFNGTPAQILSITPNLVRVRVPAGATTGLIQVSSDIASHSTAGLATPNFRVVASSIAASMTAAEIDAAFTLERAFSGITSPRRMV